jgi:DNA repair protein RadC
VRIRELQVTYVPRSDLPQYDARKILKVPREAAEFLRPILEREPVEVFVVVCLTTKHRVIGYHELGRGTVDSVLVHPREVYKIALLSNAASILVGHVHPSGDPSPSMEDLELTGRLLKAGGVMGIPLVDHIVIGHDGTYYSFKEGGRL